MKSQRQKTPAERFWEKVDKRDPDECWLWRGTTRGRGDIRYGVISLGGVDVAAHRFSYALAFGQIPQSSDPRDYGVLHRCDVPLCCNPRHLFLGDHQANMDDKVAKGRQAGKNQTHCKRGHEFTVVNTYIAKRNMRHCRACHRDAERKRRLNWSSQNRRAQPF